MNLSNSFQKLTDDKPFLFIVLFSIFLAVLRTFYVAYGPIDIAPDEAHYWEWSRYLDWSYYSKGPMVAWMIWLSTELFGAHIVAVRFFPIVTQVVLAVIAFLVARKYSNKVGGYIAFLTIQLTPEFAAGGLIMSPDIPALLFLSLAVYFLSSVDFTADKLPVKKLMLIAVFVGLAGLGKYTAGLFYPLLGLYLIVDKTRRKQYVKPYIYMMGICSLIVMLPVFYWNYLNDFVTFKHVMGQTSSNRFDALDSLSNFLGGQLGVVGPITFLMLLYYFVRPTAGQNKLNLVWFFSAPLFVFFIYQSLQGKVQPNWPVVSIYFGLIGLSVWLVHVGTKAKKIFIVGMMLSTLITVISHDSFILRAMGVDFPQKKDPLKPVLGWRQIGAELDQHIKAQPDVPILFTRYQSAGPIVFYTDSQPKPLYVNPGYRRQNQYDYWAWPEVKLGQSMFYIREWMHPTQDSFVPDVVKAGFESCLKIDELDAYRGDVLLRSAHLYLCAGYKGVERLRPEVF